MSHRPALLTVAVSALTLLSSPGEAQQSPWRAHLRGVHAQPNVTSALVPGTDSRLTIGSASAPEISLAYRVTPLWTVELGATAFRHQLATEGGSASGIDAGSVLVVPLSFSLQLHLLQGRRLDPYLGVGIGAVAFRDYKVTPELLGLGIDELTFQESVRVTSQAGLDIRIGERWFANLDVRYLPLATDVDIRRTTGASSGTVHFQFNPWLFAAGLGFSF